MYIQYVCVRISVHMYQLCCLSTTVLCRVLLYSLPGLYVGERDTQCVPGLAGRQGLCEAEDAAVEKPPLPL